MSKSSNFIKTTNNVNAGTDGATITVNGADLSTTINNIIAENVNDDIQLAGCATIAGNNVFTGSNTIPALIVPSAMSVSSSGVSLTKLPRLASTIAPTDPKDLVTVQYVSDNSLDVRPLNNTWTGTNTFNTSLPTSTILATTNTQFTNKQFVDNTVNTNITNLKVANNAWTGTNTFNTALPTSTVDPVGVNDLTRKSYVDTKVANLTLANNTWTGTNTFSKKQSVSVNVPSAYGSDITTNHVGAYDNQRALRLIDSERDSSNNVVKSADVALYPNSDTRHTTILASAGTVGVSSISVGNWSNDANGLYADSKSTSISGGSNNIVVDKTGGITCTVNPIVGTYVAPTDDKELVPKRYVNEQTTGAINNLKSSENTFTNKNTFSQTEGANGNYALGVANGSKVIGFMPNMTQGSYNGQVETNDSALIYTNGTIDGGTFDIASWSDTKNGLKLKSTQAFLYAGSNEIKLDASGGTTITGNASITGNVSTASASISGNTTIGGNVTTSGNVTIAGALQSHNTQMVGFTRMLGTAEITGDATFLSKAKLTLPVTNPSLDNELVCKKYVVDTYQTKEAVSDTTGSRISYDERALLYTPSNNPSNISNYIYGLSAVFLGQGSTSLTDNIDTTWKTCYLNTYQNFDQFEQCIIDVYKIIWYNNAIGVANTLNNNNSPVGSGFIFSDWSVKRPTAFSPNLYSGVNNTPSLGTYLIQAYDFVTPSVTQMSANRSMWNGAPVKTDYKFHTGLAYKISKHGGLNFTYIKSTVAGVPHRMAIDVGYPFCMNNPTAPYWISKIGYTINIRSGHDATGQNGWFLTAT